MSVPRTVEQLADELADDLAWRRKELVSLRSDVGASPASDTALRAGVTLLYAHWEGYVRSATILYAGYVEQKRLTYNDLGPAFLGLALKSKTTALLDAKSPSIHQAFAQFLIADLGTVAPFSRNSYEPRGIMSSAKLRAAVLRLGLSYTPYALKEALIDQTLCRTRHEVAHGKAVPIEAREFLAAHDQVVGMMNSLANDVVDAALARDYMRT